MTRVLELEKVVKSFEQAGEKLEVLNNICTQINHVLEPEDSFWTS